MIFGLNLNLTGRAVSLEVCGGGIGDFGCAQLAKLHNLESLVGTASSALCMTSVDYSSSYLYLCFL